MSAFWSAWVSVITLAVILGCTWLLFATRKSEKHKETTEETLGHEFDGIEEYDNPLPKWWFQMFLGTVIFGLGYLALYPGLGNFQGLLGWSSHGQWEEEMAHAEEQYRPVFQKYAALSIEQLQSEEDGLKMGQRMFSNNCAVCHGSAGTGAYGFPNLTDNDWLYGGEPQTLITTIANGRNGGMPAWGQVLGEDGVRDVTSYVLSLSGAADSLDGDAVARGQSQFQALCAACHGADGKGTQALGAPNLTDNTWLYGGSFEQVAHSIRNGRAGVMPAHKDLLSDEKIHLIAAYVYSLSQK
ncbi:Cytochrome c oxidase subunit CcoP [Marinobacterium lacunae]|uniref:Cbb3-type cytochrome c oxidase subunit n=1 Tax=Marinobacterium lacunae TaxID=1232683 RepID=A0A081FW80_9GAMM|nr:cytochrome-c oxidase, cbb3-type subunit III [Marinobacterium lacunae]KEA62785.1 Cytochrome c oxidase subunit CcoP [Marinobacterium lacunae]MBR9885333.1 cytochrome-c oxidase, cbb3-type subunit III [Oceanospirillales bacterium]